MESAADLIRALGGNERGMCRCPAHPDNTPSLHISEGRNGPVWKCFAGCSQEAVLAALQRLGLFTGKGMTQTPRKQDNAKDENDRWDAAYRILRVAGKGEAPTAYFRGRGIAKVPRNAKLLSASDAARLTGIRFPAMVLPVSDGNILLGAQVTFLTKDCKANLKGKNGKNVRRLFGKVGGGFISFGATDPDQPLLVTEGTEDALSVAQLTGLPAIAAGNANLQAIDPPPCAKLIICGDNDANGVGQKAADDAAARWARPGRKVCIAIPEDHKDWNDALRDPDSDHDALRWEIVRAPEYAPTQITSLGMYQFMDLQFPPRQYLLRPWLTTTGLTMIDALPGHGKTWLALSIAYAVASGKPLLGWQGERKARVLYVDGELPGELLQQRIRLLGPMLPATDLRLLAYAQFAARETMMLDLGTEEGRATLEAEIEQHEIELVILDSVTTLVRSGVDNDIESWRAIQDWSLKHRARGRTVIFLHHHGRSGNPRGTSGREIVLDARIKMSKDENLTTENETAFKLEFAKAREFFGTEAAPMIAYLSTQSDVATWRHETVKDSTKEQIRQLHEEGWKQSDIAKELGLTPGRVSQLMKELGLAPGKRGRKAKTQPNEDPKPEV